MTFKSLLNLGGFKDSHPSIERFHSGSGGYGGYHHSGSGGYHHGSRGSYKGKGGSGAALSALTLLAFLFLINCMQQSMDDQTQMATTTQTAIVLRDDEIPVIVDVKENNELIKKSNEGKRGDVNHGTPAKSKIQRLNSQYIK